MKTLPTSLEREPLVDAVFEIRMGGDPHLADLLPGILFRELDPKPIIQRLAAAEIPQPIRAKNPAMAFSPIILLDLPNFTISLGERNLIIGCKMPYPKWPMFKRFILDIVSKVSHAGLVGPVERYSLKYINLIEASSIGEQIARINMSIKLGEVTARDDHLSVQIHRSEGDTLHIISVVTGARAKLRDGRDVFGAVVDVDSIRAVDFANISEFSSNLDAELESLRRSNKLKFFSCISDAALAEMGPRYD